LIVKATTDIANSQQQPAHDIADRQADDSFHLRRVTFKGDGLQPELGAAPGQRILEWAYDGSEQSAGKVSRRTG
jgi:hypothetical protein